MNLSVYNVWGELVSVLLDSPVKAGHTEVAWNAADRGGRAFASGIYFYRLIAGDVVKTGKMVLLR
ncbi:MAG: hypothetical protein PHQ19_09095 [Candidatus Krumholzibacteria bacterium]|nr:hypothetical protein [Candidatus Krumholzibacteria bacterium]